MSRTVEAGRKFKFSCGLGYQESRFGSRLNRSLDSFFEGFQYEVVEFFLSFFPFPLLADFSCK